MRHLVEKSAYRFCPGDVLQRKTSSLAPWIDWAKLSTRKLRSAKEALAGNGYAGVIAGEWRIRRGDKVVAP